MARTPFPLTDRIPTPPDGVRARRRDSLFPDPLDMDTPYFARLPRIHARDGVRLRKAGPRILGRLRLARYRLWCLLAHPSLC